MQLPQPLPANDAAPLPELRPDRRYDRRLAIVVPYRDRLDHLRSFLPHLAAYFQRDKLDRRIAVSVHIVEPQGNAPFNRGKVKNCGYSLARDSADYVVFHDVDYLPIWADYAWSAQPARLVWHGLTLAEDPERFFGAAVLFDRDAFERVNGYPNAYWGWGPEDRELGLRCELAGLGFERRDGTYMALPHPHAGFTAPGVYSDEARRTHALWAQRQGKLGEYMKSDGLATLDFKLLRRSPVVFDGKEWSNAFHYLVDIGEPENPG